MESKILTALASYCNNPNCKWASLDSEANQKAKKLFDQWMKNNQWSKPWDGFVDIVKTNGIPNATRVSKFYEGERVLAIFNWYGATRAVIE